MAATDRRELLHRFQEADAACTAAAQSHQVARAHVAWQGESEQTQDLVEPTIVTRLTPKMKRLPCRRGLAET